MTDIDTFQPDRLGANGGSWTPKGCLGRNSAGEPGARQRDRAVIDQWHLSVSITDPPLAAISSECLETRASSPPSKEKDRRKICPADREIGEVLG
jgi:hypothetical protein